MDDFKAGVRQFIERKIDAAALQTSPFPHLVVENFFPEDVFEKILAYNPFIRNRGTEWLTQPASHNVSSRTPYHARKQINFHQNEKFEAEPEAARFWTGLKSVFLEDGWFEGLVKRKYHDYFAIRFGDMIDEPGYERHFRRELFLQRHEPGYYIGPHTDIPTRIFTCIFSFADREGYEEYGTELLAHKDPMVRCWGNDHYGPDAFEVKKVAPYKPNNFLLFFKTRQSFHSVKAITEDVPNQRYGMQFQFYEPVGGVFQDLSVPDLMTVKQKPVPAASGPVAWRAMKNTFLKRTTANAATLPADDKIAVAEGEVLVAERAEAKGDHLRLGEATLAGSDIGAGWYIYGQAWNRTKAPALEPA